MFSLCSSDLENITDGKIVDTAEFRAKDFYEKIGFSVVAVLPNNFKGYTTHIMRKNI